MNDIKSYLEKFSSFVNGLSIIDPSFLDMEVLKSIFCATSLIEIHITAPYQYLMINVDSNYDAVLQEFPTLYQELNSTKGADMLNIERQMLKLTFKKPLPRECILRSIDSSIREYKKEVVNRCCNILLPILAEGFNSKWCIIWFWAEDK